MFIVHLIYVDIVPVIFLYVNLIEFYSFYLSMLTWWRQVDAYTSYHGLSQHCHYCLIFTATELV